MDHILNPVILRQTKQIKRLKIDAQKVLKQAKATSECVIYLQNYNFSTETYDVLKTLRINRSQPQNLATCALGDSLVRHQ